MRQNRRLLTIFLIVFVDLLGFGIILPLLPYIAEKFNSTAFEIGLLTSAYSFFQLISAPILGKLSDRYGRRKMLIISQAGSVAGYILLGLAFDIRLLFLARIIDGATGGNISIAQAYIADVTDKKNRARGMGLIGAAFGLGFIFGPAIGGLLAKISFSVPAFFAAAVGSITVILTTTSLPETVEIKKAEHSQKTKMTLNDLKELLKFPIWILIVTFFLFNAAASGQQAIFALWTQTKFNYGPTQTGWLFAYLGIIIVIMQLGVLPRLVKTIKEKLLYKISFLILALGFLSFALVMHPAFLYFTLALIAFGQAFVNPLTQSLASENISTETQGGTMGFIQSAGSLGRIIGPALGGLMYSVNFNLTFNFSGLVMILIFIFLIFALK